jgi:hypothetical protein
VTRPGQERTDAVDLVRPYVITGGRQLPHGDEFELVTLVTVAEGPRPQTQLDPERRAVLELCSGGYLSVAEIAGHLGQPVGVIRVLLAELSDLGYLMTRRPVPAAQLTDVHVLQEVLDGLQARFG